MGSSFLFTVFTECRLSREVVSTNTGRQGDA